MSGSRQVGLVVCALLFSTAGGVSSAQGRAFVGARNLAMGSTGIASTTDALSVHFNPAGMAFSKSWDFQLPLITVDADINDGGFLAQFDELGDLFQERSLDDIQAAFDQGSASKQDLETALDAFLYKLPSISAVDASGNVRGLAGPAFRWKNWGVSISAVGSGGLEATIDLDGALALTAAANINNAIPTDVDCAGDPFCLSFANHLVGTSGNSLDQASAEALVAAAGSQLEGNAKAQEILTKIVAATSQNEATLANNATAVLTTGWVGAQFAFTYSHMVLAEKLSVGGSLKAIQAQTYVEATILSEIEDTDALIDSLTDQENTETSTAFGLDLGVMYQPTPKWSIGLAGTNINSPSFDLGGGRREEVELGALYRAGMAYRPFKWFNLTADLDLNEVGGDAIPNRKYQFANLGFEFLAGRWFSGWVGGYHNFAPDQSDPVITAGVGFGIKRFQIALAGAASTGETKIESSTFGDGDTTIPSGAAVAISLAWRAKREI